MLDGLISLLKTFFTQFIQWLLDWIFAAIDQLLGVVNCLIPDLHVNTYYVEFVNYASWANKWVPIDFGFYLIGLYLIIKMTVQLINWILGLIPFVN
jgi:hypothetical protein